jgi:hypothetical protein
VTRILEEYARVAREGYIPGVAGIFASGKSELTDAQIDPSTLAALLLEWQARGAPGPRRG